VRRVPPSTVTRRKIDRLLGHGLDREASLLFELAELGLRYLVQPGLEQEHAHRLLDDVIGEARPPDEPSSARR
jgi:hypothetical protein